MNILNKQLSRSDKVNILASILLVAGVVALVFNYVIMGSYVENAEWPINSLGQLPEIFANDFTRIYGLVQNLAPYQEVRNYIPHEAFPYGPLSVLFMWFFTFIPMEYALWVFYAIFTALFLRLNQKYLSVDNKIDNYRNLFVITFITFPFYYLIDRGNLEGYTFIFTAAGVLSYFDNRVRLATVFLLIASAMKLHPAIFFLLYLKDRRYKEFFIAAAVGALIVVILFSAFEGGFIYSVKGFLNELSMTRVCYATVAGCANLSLIVPYKIVLSMVTSAQFISQHQQFVALSYNIFCMLVLAFTFWIICVCPLPRWKQVLLLVLMMYFIPVMSFEYKLIYMFLPIYLFVNNKPSKRDAFFIVLMALLIVPKNYASHSQVLINYTITITLYLAIVRDALVGKFTFIEKVDKRISWPAIFITLLAAVALYAATVLYKKSYIPPIGQEETYQLNFSQDDYKAVYGDGWGAYEADAHSTWRWAVAKEAFLNLKLRKGKNFDVTADIYNHAANGAQFIEVYLDDNFITRFDIAPNEGRQIRFTISKEALDNVGAVQRLRFIFHQNNKPSETEPRNLAVSFSKIVFKRLSE